MAQDKLGDLDSHLFAALERLGDQSLDPKQIEAEVARSGAIIGVADQVIQNAKIKLAAATLFAIHGAKVQPMLPQIGKSD